MIRNYRLEAFSGTLLRVERILPVTGRRRPPMTARKPCPEAPGPLEAYARQFDACFGSLAQRRAFRAYLEGLLLPRDRNKTLTTLAGTEPGVGAQHPAAQQ